MYLLKSSTILSALNDRDSFDKRNDSDGDESCVVVRVTLVPRMS